MKTRLLILLLFIGTSFINAQNYSIQLMKNINPNGSSSPNSFFEFNDKVYFAADDGINGSELWVTDGTALGTKMVKDLNPSESSNPHNFFVFNNKLYFIASNHTNTNPEFINDEIWMTDGTASGTQMLKDIKPGIFSSDPQILYVDQDIFYFSADDGVNGVELWVSDGTPLGTKFLKNINPGSGGSNPRSFILFENNLFFVATNGINGYEIWQTDGTMSGTQLFKDINPGNASSNPNNFTILNNKLYFSANDDMNGMELWVTDGTYTGTTLVKDIRVGGGDSNPSNLVVWNNKIYFAANQLTDDNELWVTDGTALGTKMVKDLNPSLSSNPHNFFVFNNKLYFIASNHTNTNPDFINDEIWMTDGTASGTQMLKDIRPGIFSSNPQIIYVDQDIFYFSADDGVNGVELWKSDGTAIGTQLLKDINGPGGSNPTGMLVWNGKFYFTADGGSSVKGIQLWRTEGTHSGTEMLQPSFNTANNPLASTNYFVYQGDFYFTASYDNNGLELYKFTDLTLDVSDDTAIETITIYPNPTRDILTVEGLTKVEIFSITNDLGQEVWRSMLGKDKNTFSIENLPNGIYLLHNRDYTIQKKVIKE
ncbi:MAG: T9SS type A sorting domain-containing protein [Brumimicrobium sp.]|nr:T9SS type A sorting domain-containing protein [Brumimicrobium sp.]